MCTPQSACLALFLTFFSRSVSVRSSSSLSSSARAPNTSAGAEPLAPNRKASSSAACKDPYRKGQLYSLLCTGCAATLSCRLPGMLRSWHATMQVHKHAHYAAWPCSSIQPQVLSADDDDSLMLHCHGFNRGPPPLHHQTLTPHPADGTRPLASVHPHTLAFGSSLYKIFLRLLARKDMLGNGKP